MLVSSTQAESGRQPLERQGATPRPTAPRPRNLPGSLHAAFRAGLLVALAASPGLAQTAPTFLSNTAETAGGSYLVGLSRYEGAIRFSTSGPGAYLLSSVALDIATVTSGASLTVQLRYSAGDTTATTPGDVVATFTGPATLGTGLQTFTAPPNGNAHLHGARRRCQARSQHGLRRADLAWEQRRAVSRHRVR